MRLTRAGEYAIRCVAFLATLDDGKLATRTQIAEATEIPPHFLAKIAQQLSNSGVIDIIQGSRGGLRLARAPADVTMLDVVEAVTGRISLNDCVMHPETCPRSDECPIHQVWVKATAQLRETLSQANFGHHCLALPS